MKSLSGYKNSWQSWPPPESVPGDRKKATDSSESGQSETPTSDPGRLIDSEELAAHLSLTVAAVTRLARRGEVPAYKVGQLWRFNLDEVLSSLRQEAGSDKD